MAGDGGGMVSERMTENKKKEDVKSQPKHEKYANGSV